MKTIHGPNHSICCSAWKYFWLCRHIRNYCPGDPRTINSWVLVRVVLNGISASSFTLGHLFVLWQKCGKQCLCQTGWFSGICSLLCSSAEEHKWGLVPTKNEGKTSFPSRLYWIKKLRYSTNHSLWSNFVFNFSNNAMAFTFSLKGTSWRTINIQKDSYVPQLVLRFWTRKWLWKTD